MVPYTEASESDLGQSVKQINPTTISNSAARAPTPANVITLDLNGAESLAMSAKSNEVAGLWIDCLGTAEEMAND